MNKQATLPLHGIEFAVAPGAHVAWLGETWIVATVHEANCAGRIPTTAINMTDGRTGMPMLDEVRLVHPAIKRGGSVVEISDDTAERFAAYARAR